MSKFKVGDEVIVFKSTNEAFDEDVGSIHTITKLNTYKDSSGVWHEVRPKYQLPEELFRKVTKLDKVLK